MTKEKKEKIQVSMRLYPEIWHEFKRMCSERKMTTGDYMTQVVINLFCEEVAKHRMRSQELRRKYHEDYYDRCEFEAICREQHIDPDELRVFLYEEETNDNCFQMGKDDVRDFLNEESKPFKKVEVKAHMRFMNNGKQGE